MTPPVLTLDLSPLPEGQQRVAFALISGKKARTYREVAAQLELFLGTVYEHLRRIRTNHPDLYRALMEVRRAQLGQRHEIALAKAQAHSRRYFKRKSNFAYYQRFGYWPWERYVRKG